MSTSQGHFHEADDQELTLGVERNRKETLELRNGHQKIWSTNLFGSQNSFAGKHGKGHKRDKFFFLIAGILFAQLPHISSNLLGYEMWGAWLY